MFAHQKLFTSYNILSSIYLFGGWLYMGLFSLVINNPEKVFCFLLNLAYICKCFH